MSHGTASDKQQQLHLYPIEIGDEAKSGLLEDDAPVTFIPLMERVLDKENLQNAYHRVRRNKGGAGIDGVTVDDLPALIKTHWTTIRTQLLEGSYQPQAVKQVLIPKAGGGERKLGYLQYLIGLSSRHCYKCCSLSGIKRFPILAMALDRSDQGIKRWRSHNKRSTKAISGSWTWIWRNFSIVSTMTS